MGGVIVRDGEGFILRGYKCRVYEKQVSLQRPHQGFRV